MNKPRVLFLCTGIRRAARWQRHFLRAYAGDHFEVHSAGLEPTGYILPEVLGVMQERGLDLAGQSSKGVSGVSGKNPLFPYHHSLRRCRGELSRRLPQHGDT